MLIASIDEEGDMAIPPDDDTVPAAVDPDAMVVEKVRQALMDDAPKPASSSQDYWEKRGFYIVCVHQEPRTQMFSPPGDP